MFEEIPESYKIHYAEKFNQENPRRYLTGNEGRGYAVTAANYAKRLSDYWHNYWRGFEVGDPMHR